MAKKAIAKDLVANAVSSGATEALSIPGYAATAGNGHAPQSRDALELSKLSLELNQLEADVLGPDELRAKRQDEREKSALDLKKLRRDDAYEQQKTEIELQKLRRDAANEQEKSDLEMRKLRDETRNARRSQYFEFCKVVVPALSICATIWVAADSIGYQRNKDRTVDISKQLVHFQEQIAAADPKKQRNAIAAVRSLRENAIPSLVANLDVGHNHEILMAIHAAILELNDDSALQRTILRELLSAIKYVTLRPNLAHLRYYQALWVECLRQYEKDQELFRHAVASADQLATALEREIPSKKWNEDTVKSVTAAVAQFKSQR